MNDPVQETYKSIFWLKTEKEGRGLGVGKWGEKRDLVVFSCLKLDLSASWTLNDKKFSKLYVSPLKSTVD